MNAADSYERSSGATQRALEARMDALMHEYKMCLAAMRQPRINMANALIFLGRLIEQVVNERKLVFFVREPGDDATFLSSLLSYLNEDTTDPDARELTEADMRSECEQFRRLVDFIRMHMSVHDFSGRVMARGSSRDTVQLQCSVRRPFDDYETEEERMMRPDDDDLAVDITFAEANVSYPGGVSTHFARHTMQRIILRDRHLRNPIDEESSPNVVTVPFDFDFNGYVYRETADKSAVPVITGNVFEYNLLTDEEDEEDDEDNTPDNSISAEPSSSQL
jgi:hypothetical protein